MGDQGSEQGGMYINIKGKIEYFNLKISNGKTNTVGRDNRLVD